MKAYVNYFDTDEAHATRPDNDNSIHGEDFVVQFSALPDVTISTELAARTLCAHLNDFDVHAAKWPGHTCRF